MAHHDDDLDTNVSTNPHISEVIGERLLDPSRRTLLKSGLGFGALSFMGVSASFLSGCLEDDRGPKRPGALTFNAVPKGMADLVTVPAGYTATAYPSWRSSAPPTAVGATGRIRNSTAGCTR